MYRDVTELPITANCVKIIDDKTLAVYTNEDVGVYKLLSNKYYKTDTYDPNTPPTEAVCYTTEDVSTIPSPFDFITPIYHVTAILSVWFIFYLAYRLIIHPWWRKK